MSLLDTYWMLSSSDRKLYERYMDNRDHFSLVSSNDPSARRDAKIGRYKKENELKLKLEVCATFSLQAVYLANEHTSSFLKSHGNFKETTRPFESYLWPKSSSVSTIHSMH